MRKGQSAAATRGAWIWLALAATGLLALPWDGLERGILASSWRPAALLAVTDRPWLIPLIPPLLLAAWAIATRHARALLWAGLFALAWLILEAFGIRAHGLRSEALAAAFGAAAQPPLGWGALLYAAAALVLTSYGLAWRGWCGGEVFTVAAIGIVCASILTFVGYPVACILISAFQDNAGATDLALFASKITDGSIWGLDCLTGGATCGVAWNSLALGTIVGVLSTLLGLAFALVSARTRFPAPRVLRVMSLLPVITPPFVIGLALILLFGRSGMVSNLLRDLFDIPRSRWIYGLPGLVIAQLLAFTPISYLVLLGVLKGVAPSLEEASSTLRSSRWHTFRHVTWPLIRPGLANAFLIAFIESLADFGNPMVLGGNFRVLSTAIYFAVVGAAHDQGGAAVLALVLLTFTLTAFVLQRAWLGRRSYVTVSGKGDGGLPAPLPRGLRVACYAVVVPWLTLTAAIYGLILVGGFVKAIGTDNTPTLEHFLTAFRIGHGVGGWFLAGSAWSSLLTTLQVALLSMPLTAALGILTAYLLSRQRFAGRALFEFMTMMSFAIPGTVIGIAYILAFNVPPIELTGTALIMVVAFVFRNMPVGIRAGIAGLAQVDKSLDEASLTLGARSAATLRRVILPILRPAIATSMVYAFVRAITSVSAVIFLVSGEYNLATVYIVGRAEFGEHGIAIVYSAVLIAIMVTALLLIQLAVGERKIGRREVEREAAVAARPAAAGI